MQRYGLDAVAGLEEGTAYETKLLELLASAAQLAEGGVDPTEVRLRSDRDGAVVGARCRISVSDHVGAGHVTTLIAQLSPLVLVACHKLLDTVVEWVLEENRQAGILETIPWQYANKAIQIARNGLVMPKQFAANPWLKEIAFSLFTRLIPFRNEIIHGTLFGLRAGKLEVTPAKANPPETLLLDEQQLGALVRLSVGIARSLTADGYLDKYSERLLRFHSDQLQRVHGLPAFGQPEPLIVNVVFEAEEKDGMVAVDLAHVRAKLHRMHGGRDVLFNLTIEALREGRLVATKQLAYGDVPEGSEVSLPVEPANQAD